MLTKDDSHKLRVLADWFDCQDIRLGRNDRQVQQDLRRMADDIEEICEEMGQCG